MEGDERYFEDEPRASLGSFEELLIEVLTQDHDLEVRRSDDPLDRRRANVGTLDFAYRYADGPAKATVVVSIEDVPGFSSMLRADFSCEDSMRQAAEQCEALALFLTEHLDECGERLIPEPVDRNEEFDRREDDLP